MSAERCLAYAKSAVIDPRYKTKELRIPLAAQGLLVTLQRFAEPLQLVASASLIKVGERHRTVRGNGLIVTPDGLFQLFQTLQRGALLDQRLGVPGIDPQRLVEAGDRVLSFFLVEEFLPFFEYG